MAHCSRGCSLAAKSCSDDGHQGVAVGWGQGFALKVPRPRSNGQDQEKRKTFLEWFGEILANSDTDAWYLDETGIEADPRPRRRWAQKGEKIRLPYEGTHIRMSATGTVCPRSGEFHALMFSHSDTEIFRIFLDHANEDIGFERKRNLLIMDNASSHKSKSIRWGRFEPVFLPPYSPDLNSIERLWLLMKAEWFSGFFAKTRDDLIDRLCDALNWVIDRKTKIHAPFGKNFRETLYTSDPTSGT
ncbi:MAG: IS630 family transposase [Desulfomonile tiedjei]|nr:IS630 family transposase [Desulfomonile tiedjei]